MYRGTSIWGDMKNEFKKGNIIIRLIFINIAIFLILNIGFFIIKQIINQPGSAAVFINQFTVPADLSKLASRPWTLITHMFSHEGIFHILFNMLWLYWMGRILMEYIGARKILPIYIMGGLSGAFLYILAFNIIPGFEVQLPGAEALGASAAVLAIIVATATLLPDYSIGLILIGPVKLKYLALFAVALDIVGINGLNAGGSIAHMGGALFGFLYIRQVKNGQDWANGFNSLMDSIIGVFVKPKGPRVHYKNTAQQEKSSRSKSRKNRSKETSKNVNQEKLDAILDKISRSGYEGLTKEEKEFLFKVSNEE